jgi:hypothetical protein
MVFVGDGVGRHERTVLHGEFKLHAVVAVPSITPVRRRSID